MAIRNIVTKEDEVLHKVCKPVEKFDQKLWTLLDDMAETLEKANGVGLAAPQVGMMRRLAIVDTGEEILELINPKITTKAVLSATLKDAYPARVNTAMLPDL